MNAMYEEMERISQQHKKDRLLRELEMHREMMRLMYATPQYRLEFSAILPDDKAIFHNNTLFVPESQAYKWIFMNNNVTDKTVQFAVNYAIRKVHKFIDNYNVPDAKA